MSVTWWLRPPRRNSDDIYGAGTLYYYFIYPNVMLDVVPGRLMAGISNRPCHEQPV